MTSPTLLFSMPGGSEWILLVLIVLLIFGGKKIPELMKGIGKGIREFKDAKDKTSIDAEDGNDDKVLVKKGSILPANP